MTTSPKRGNEGAAQGIQWLIKVYTAGFIGLFVFNAIRKSYYIKMKYLKDKR